MIQEDCPLIIDYPHHLFHCTWVSVKNKDPKVSKLNKKGDQTGQIYGCLDHQVIFFFMLNSIEHEIKT